MKQMQLIEADKPIIAECGSIGLKRYGGRIDEEWLGNLRGLKARRKFREMADNDPNIAAALYLIESLLTSVTWSVEANPSGHPLAEECKEHIESCFADMEQTWQEILPEILTAMVFGWSVLEPTYKIRRGDHKEPRLNSQHNDGAWGWRSWSPRPQETLDRWEFTDEGRVIGFWQTIPETGQTLYVPLDRCLHFKFQGSKSNPEGRSFLRSAYTSYYYAQRLREIEAIGVERNVAGMPDIQVPAELLNPNATAQQKQMLAYWLDLGKKIRTDSLYCIVRPSESTPDGKNTGYRFGLVSASGRNFAETDTIIRRWEQRILMTFLAEMLQLGQNGVGSFSMHSDKTTTLAMSLSRVLDTIDAVTNRDAIPKLCRMNGYPPEAYPYHVHGDIEKTAVVEWAQSVSNLVAGGVLEADDDVRNEARRLLDLPPIQNVSMTPLVDESIEEPEEPEEQVQIEAAQDQMPPGVLNVDEAAEYLRISRASVMSAIRRGQLPGAKAGSGYRIARADLDRYLAGAHGV